MDNETIKLPQDLVDNKPGGYTISNIFLMESNFSRSFSTEPNQEGITNEISINNEYNDTSIENQFGVTLILNFKGRLKDEIICSSTIKMLAIFEKTGTPQVSQEAFQLINAPAIIYPFVREHLYNLCLKAGIGNVLLPTINFRL